MLASSALQIYGDIVDFVVCPVDGAKLKADTSTRVAGAALLLHCPTRAQAFSLTNRGLQKVPEDRRDD
jgi:hypothetical protein